MDPNIGWELYRTFLGVLDEGSLSAAARRLGITQPTAGRHVVALETSLGQALFTRTQTGLKPTEVALDLREHAEAMQRAAAALARAAAGRAHGSATGTVRVAASEIVGVEVLPPTLVRLREAHPRLRVELVLSDQLQDLLQREVDLAVRMVTPVQGQLVARPVGAIELGLFAHGDYLARRGVPQTVEQLAEHSLIGFDAETPFIRAARERLPRGLPWTRAAFGFRADSNLAQLALIRAGGGIGWCQVPLAARPTPLVRVLAEPCTMRLPTWVAMHEGLRRSGAAKAVFDALVRDLLAYTAGADAIPATV